jgi:choice-of-anchor B domain-containing protein
MRATLPSLALASLLAASGAWGHDDLLGTRHVAMGGVDEGDCSHAHHPCATIAYALAQTPGGGTVKVSVGLYSIASLDVDEILHGKSGVMGGYSTADGFKHQDFDVNITKVTGAAPRHRERLASRGLQLIVEDFGDRMMRLRGELSDERPLRQSVQQAVLQTANCVQGFAGPHPCRNVDLLGHVALDQLSSRPGTMSNLWGFVDRNDNREYAVVGVSNGTAVIDVTNPQAPREVGTVPGNSSLWREVKVLQFFDAPANRYRAYAYLSTEAVQGMQVLDLSGLPNSVTLANTISEYQTSHTLYVSNIDHGTCEALPGRTPFLYIAGANRNGGSFLIFSLANPAAPQLVTQAPPGTGYMHDSTSLYLTDNRTAQCDQGHNPCEVLVDFNESTVDLWDVTNKSNPVRLSATGYPSARYTHSGWFTADQRAIIVHDELDELRIAGQSTQIYTLEIDDLRAPSIVTSYVGPGTTTDHNGYTKGDRYYVSHYKRGLVVFDVSNPRVLREVGNLDTFLQPASDAAGTDGAWGVYPFLPSGNILISDIDNGLFVLRDSTRNLDASVGRLGFGALSFATAEGGAPLRAAVRRTGGSLGSVSVQYATRDGTALAGSDYSSASGTLTWNAGDDADKFITIPITDDSGVENNEEFALVLSNLTGGATLDGATEATVTLTSNDSAGGGGGGRGGGGGSSDLLVLALLALAASARAARRRCFG